MQVMRMRLLALFVVVVVCGCVSFLDIFCEIRNGA